MTTTATDPAKYLTLQFLTWLNESPRSYGDAMDAWRTSCPRLSIWEDALRDGLIERQAETDQQGKMREFQVALTPRGKKLLSSAKA